MSASTQTDEQIVQRVLAGNRQEFEELVSRYLPILQAFTFAHVGNRADAEDASQEAFLRAFQSLDKLRDQSRFGAWLVGIARHTCSAIRNARRKQARVSEEVRQAPTAVEPDVTQRDLRELVRTKIAELDEPSREVLLLYYFSGKKIHEVADLLGISPDAAAKRIQRAREALGGKLLHALQPAVELERPEEERKSKIMALILLMPVSWEAPPFAAARVPKKTATPPAASAATATASAFLSKYWILVLSVAVFGLLAAGAWLLLDDEPPQKPPVAAPARPAIQTKSPAPVAQPKASTPSKDEGSMKFDSGARKASKGKG